MKQNNYWPKEDVHSDIAVQHCLEYFGFQYPDLELEGDARSVVQFEGILRGAAPGVAYAPVDLDGQVGVVVDVPPEVYENVHLFVYLVGSLDAECGGGIRHPLVRKHIISVLASETFRPKAAHTVTITSIIFFSCSGDFDTTPASSAYSMPQSDVAGAGSVDVVFPRSPAPVFFLRPTRASMIPSSASKRE